MQITHLGHAALLVEVAGQVILLDPGSFSDVSAVGPVTAVWITHQHPDHLSKDALTGALEASGADVPVYADPSSAAILAEANIAATATAAGQEYSLGAVTLRGVGAKHAQISEYLDLIDNVGVVISAPDEPTLFHPGDAIDGEPGEVDVLAVPLNAPWAAARETAAFVRSVAPGVIVPIHDALLSTIGRGGYLTHLSTFGFEPIGEPSPARVRDLAGAGPTQF